MEARLKKVVAVAGLFSFILCLAGGIWILRWVGISKEDPLSTGIGLYFVGKALFVGTLLVITGSQGKS